jgi:seryl-tRNA(Sec) selenium transferase
MPLKTARLDHLYSSPNKKRWEFFEQRLLDYPIEKLGENLTEITKQLQGFARTTLLQIPLIAKKAQVGSEKLPNERIAP